MTINELIKQLEDLKLCNQKIDGEDETHINQVI